MQYDIIDDDGWIGRKTALTSRGENSRTGQDKTRQDKVDRRNSKHELWKKTTRYIYWTSGQCASFWKLLAELAERGKALETGSSPKGRGFESRASHNYIIFWQYLRLRCMMLLKSCTIPRFVGLCDDRAFLSSSRSWRAHKWHSFLLLYISHHQRLLLQFFLCLLPSNAAKQCGQCGALGPSAKEERAVESSRL